MARFAWISSAVAMVLGCGFDSRGLSDESEPLEPDDASVASEGSSGDASSSSGPGPASPDDEDDDGSDGSETGNCIEQPFYADADGDGFGRSDAMVMACAAPPEHATQDGDCDDLDAHVHPDADERCNDRDDDCDGATDEWSPRNSSCNGCEATLAEPYLYYACASAWSWSEAAASCEARGAVLTSIVDQAENDFVADLLGEQIPWAWIGLSDLDTEGTFTWLDGSSSSFVGWGGGQPDDASGIQDCVMMGRGPRQWFDRQCNNPDNPDDQKAHGFVCKAVIP